MRRCAQLVPFTACLCGLCSVLKHSGQSLLLLLLMARFVGGKQQGGAVSSRIREERWAAMSHRLRQTPDRISHAHACACTHTDTLSLDCCGMQNIDTRPRCIFFCEKVMSTWTCLKGEFQTTTRESGHDCLILIETDICSPVSRVRRRAKRSTV